MSDQSVQKAFEDFKILRQKNIELIESISIDKLMTIPDGFSNNIYWHAGHILTVQESLIYRRSGLEMIIDDSFLAYFGKGSSPSDFDDSIPTIQEILEIQEKTVKKLALDIQKGQSAMFAEEVTVSFGFTLNSFNEAVIALPYHEAYHLGSMKLLSKFIN